MYHQKLVASIKANGKILREINDTVYVPYGTEYSILIKNLNTVRAVVNIYIDGKDVVEGGLVIAPGKSVDLERAVTSTSLVAGNKFKFIERTPTIEEYRGVELEDGLIRIEYQYEAIAHPVYVDKWHMPAPSYDYNNWFRSYNIGSSTATYSADSVPVSASSDTGITVPGSKSDQQFQAVSSFTLLPEKHSIVLCLKGETEQNKRVTTAVTTKHKPKCITCGKQNKATAKFCSNCGTALELFT